MGLGGLMGVTKNTFWGLLGVSEEHHIHTKIGIDYAIHFHDSFVKVCACSWRRICQELFVLVARIESHGF